MQQNMADFENSHQNATANPGAFAKKETSTPSKGDYIDFEEIK